MSAVLERGPAAAEDTAPAPHRRRWPWVVAIVVVALLALVLLLVVVAAARYQPLRLGSLGGGTSDDVEVRRSANVYGDQLTFVGPDAGDTGRVYASLYNNGRFPVTVESFGMQQWVRAGLLDSTQTRVRVSFNSSRTEPFTPRRLEPGEEMAFTFLLAFTGCGKVNHGWTALTGLPVTYSAFGVQHTVTIDLQQQQALALKDYHSCFVDQTQG